MDKDQESVTLVAEYMCDILGVDSIKEIATNAYVNNIVDTMPLMPALAEKSGSEYILATYLLWQYNIPFSTGTIVLAKTESQIYTPLGEVTKENELALLVDILLASLSQVQLRQLANEAYAYNTKDTIPLVKMLAERSNDIDINIASLLWQNSIPFAIGQKLLAVGDVQVNDAPPVEAENDIETIQLIDLLCASLSGNDMKLIVRKAYADNTINIQSMVRALFKKTKSRFYKTIWLLRKYNIFIPNGLIILDRVNEYCDLNKNKYYVDLCIYKDIFEAIRASNSSWLKGKKSTT